MGEDLLLSLFGYYSSIMALVRIKRLLNLREEFIKAGKKNKREVFFCAALTRAVTCAILYLTENLIVVLGVMLSWHHSRFQLKSVFTGGSPVKLRRSRATVKPRIVEERCRRKPECPPRTASYFSPFA